MNNQSLIYNYIRHIRYDIINNLVQYNNNNKLIMDIIKYIILRHTRNNIINNNIVQYYNSN